MTREIVLTDTAGRPVRPLAPDDLQAGVVLLFIRHDCPISNSYAPEINRICQAYAGEGKEKFKVYLVHIDTDLTVDEAAKHAKDFGYTCPVLLDTHRELVKQVAARVTPEAVVLSRAGRIVYKGRIDDKWAGYGRSRPEPTTRDLRTALDAVLAGRPVPDEQKTSIGCPIE